MLFTMSAVMSLGAGLPGISAVVMMMSDFARLLRVHLALGLLEAFAHHLGIAAAAGALFLVVDLDELAAERRHLVGYLRPGVVGTHDRAQVRGGADRGKPRHARARDEDLRRRNLSGRGDLAVEEAAERIGGLDDGAVAADAGHRRERVHLLGPRELARQAVDREHGGLLRGQLLHQRGVLGRPDEVDQHAALADQPNFLRARRAHLEDDVRFGPKLGRRGHDLGTRGAVGVVGEVGGLSRTRLDGDAEAQLDQLLDDLRHGGHALLAREDFRGHSDQQ